MLHRRTDKKWNEENEKTENCRVVEHLGISCWFKDHLIQVKEERKINKKKQLRKKKTKKRQSEGKNMNMKIMIYVYIFCGNLRKYLLILSYHFKLLSLTTLLRASSNYSLAFGNFSSHQLCFGPATTLFYPCLPITVFEVINLVACIDSFACRKHLWLSCLWCEWGWNEYKWKKRKNMSVKCTHASFSIFFVYCFLFFFFCWYLG